MTTDHPEIREIITKAICGKGSYKYQRSIDLEIPVKQQTIQVLGNFVSNAALDDAVVVEHNTHGKAVQVKGHYDVHVWYAYDQDTRAAKTTVSFIEYIPLQTFLGEVIANQQAFATITQKPSCYKSYLKKLGDKYFIRVEIEQGLAAEAVGLVKLKVAIAALQENLPKPVTGIELVAPSNDATDYVRPIASNGIDLKCEEDLFEEEDDDYHFGNDQYHV